MDREKMKNILILCDAFPPAFNPRMGYLCKYLPEYGWNPIIVTEYSPQKVFNNLSKSEDIKYINFFWRNNGKLNNLKYLFIFFAELFVNYKNIIFKRTSEKLIKQHNISMILSSVSWRAFPALTAKWLSKKYNIPYIVDCRDIYEQFPNCEYTSKFFLKSSFLSNMINFIVQKKYKIQRNKLLRKANAVTTVSEWHKSKLLKYNKKSSLIFNGFDDEFFNFERIEKKTFNITYTGRIESEAVKDPSLFFEAISYLSEKKMITSEKVRLQFYLLNQSSKDIIIKLAEKHHVTNFIDIFDSVSNEKIPAILNESSILLLLSNRSVGEKTPKGIMGTKTFEYLAVEKPVLCVRNDEDCLEKTIKLANAGVSASNKDDVEKFILEKYNEWKINGFTHQNINKQYIKQFSRKFQAEQFVALFEEMLEVNRAN